MLNKKNIIISGLASVMLTYSFNYIAMAGLDKIKMPNTNASISKPSHVVNTATKAITNHHHVNSLKAIALMKSHIIDLLPPHGPIHGPGDGSINTEIIRKLRIAKDLTNELDKAMANEEILDGFNPYKVRLSRLYKDHNNQLLKRNADIELANTEYQKKAEAHTMKMNETEKQLNKEIAGHEIKLSDIDARIKAKEMLVHTDVHTFFNKEVQPHLVTTIKFDKLTIGSLATIAYSK
jgi:hypothetical protein